MRKLGVKYHTKLHNWTGIKGIIMKRRSSLGQTKESFTPTLPLPSIQRSWQWSNPDF